MAEKLGDRLVRGLPAPASGSKITYDSEVAGFAVRVTANGAKAFILRYRFAGRSRLLTIGSFPDWSTTAAREEAARLKRRIDLGEDPMGERHDERAAPTMGRLIDTFKTDYLPKRRPATVYEYTSILDKIIRPELGETKVRDVVHADIERLHRKVSVRAPLRANRVAALFNNLMNYAIKLGWRSDNPVKGLERNPEDRRERYLSPPELRALAQALREHCGPAERQRHKASAHDRRPARRSAGRDLGHVRPGCRPVDQAQQPHQAEKAAPGATVGAGAGAVAGHSCQPGPARAVRLSGRQARRALDRRQEDLGRR